MSKKQVIAAVIIGLFGLGFVSVWAYLLLTYPSIVAPVVVGVLIVLVLVWAAEQFSPSFTKRRD